jgi:plastocyanin
MSGQRFRRTASLSVILTMSALGLLVLGAGPASAGGGCHGPFVDAKGTTVDIRNACFTPSNLWVPRGQGVPWTTGDRFEQVVGGAGGWGTYDPLREGGTVTVRFDKPGVYPYTFYLHPGMNGAVIVGAVSAPAGTVTSDSVPQQAVATEPAPSPGAAEAADADAAARAAATSPGAGAWPVAAVAAFVLFVATAGGWMADRLRHRRGATG